MLETNIGSSTITLTPTAINAVKYLFAKNNLTDDHALRIFISGGGCSGFQYGLAFDADVRPEDTTYEMDGIKVVVDEMSILYLNGSQIDYIEDAQGSGFKIDNPNSMGCSGCGSSRSEGDGCGSSGGCCGN